MDDISALLRKGALKALGGQPDFPRDVPLKVNNIGRYILSVVAFGEGRSSKTKSPTFRASYSGSAFSEQRPSVSCGGFRVPYAEEGL